MYHMTTALLSSPAYEYFMVLSNYCAFHVLYPGNQNRGVCTPEIWSTAYWNFDIWLQNARCLC